MLNTNPGAYPSKEAAPVVTNNTYRPRQVTIPAFVILLASLWLIQGCGSITVSDQNAAPAGYPVSQARSAMAAPSVQELHDLAIAAVDFDPSLDINTILSGRPYSLLVAVENKGNRNEGPITVTAQLLSQDRRQVLLSAQRSISMLAAGDITVVHFPIASTPPRQPAYALSTQVQVLPREANTSNNQRVLDININTSN